MKKRVYYAMPFIVVPLLMLLCEVIDNVSLFPMTPYVMGVLLLLASVVFGFFSSSDGVFDYLMTLIMPAALFCFLFVVGFLDKSDLGSQFHLYKALDASTQPIALLYYVSMAMTTFLTSLRCFRRLKKGISR